ncbi:MAG: LysM domain-containing protein [Chitinophagaceae bacterium]
MKRSMYLIFILTLLVCIPGAVRASDTLYAGIRNGRMYAMHNVVHGETIYSIAQKYSVPALVLSQNNNISFYDPLADGSLLVIPLGNYNFYKTATEGTAPLYYRAGQENMGMIARAADMSEPTLRALNPEPASAILIGWVSYLSDKPSSHAVVSSGTSGVTTIHTNPIQRDTLREPVSELEKIYNYQTTNEEYLDSASGMVVFFKPQTTVNSKLLFAFSNEVRKGRVIKIINPSNQKFIFAKVIGPLPATRQYVNARLGVDGRARDLLETREIKLWCNLYFKY